MIGGIVSLLLAAASMAAPGPADPRLLDRLDQVAALYRDTALRFSCDEKIAFADRGKPTRFYNFEYIYAFSEATGLEDYRVDARESRGPGKSPPFRRLSDYSLPYYLTRSYSWVFLLDRAHRGRFRYTIGAQASALERPAIPVTFEPIEPVEVDVNDWYGTVWLDAETLQPLRVEAMKAVEREKEKAFEAALASTAPLKGAAKEGWVVGRVSTDFDHVKNAMRFPGRVTATGSLHKVRIKRGRRVPEVSTLFTVTQLYVNYQFFGVRAEETIRRIGEGAQP